MLITDKLSPQELQEKIESLGNSLIVVGADDVIKVHIHSNNPGKVFEIAGSYGELDRMKIENMRLEFRERLAENKKAHVNKDEEEKYENKKDFTIIAVSAGKGLDTIMRDSGVDYIIEGGQTMNPSTNDFISVIEKISQNDIFIFPNNSNIIMAANQAKDMSDKNIRVIPTKNIPQCIQALIAMNTFSSFGENEKLMNEAIEKVKSAQVTFAVRDTKSDGLDIKKDDFIGLTGKAILSAEKDLKTATVNLIKKLVDEDSEIVSLFYGEDVSKEDADEIAELISEELENVEVEVYYGGQPVYYYLISVE
jgi:DAK2 domain protein